jgi:hypothetical protein
MSPSKKMMIKKSEGLFNLHGAKNNNPTSNIHDSTNLSAENSRIKPE